MLGRPSPDIYALGAILYELLTGRPPFRGETPLDTVLQVMSEEPVPVRQLAPKAPRDLETVCMKCLQKQPSRRYASAGELADDLRRFQNHELISARPTGSWDRFIKWAKRHPSAATLLLAGLLGLTTLLGIGFYFNIALANWPEQKEIEARNAVAPARISRGIRERERHSDADRERGRGKKPGSGCKRPNANTTRRLNARRKRGGRPLRWP